MSDFRAEFDGGSINYGDSFNAQLATLYIDNLVSSEADGNKWLSHLLEDTRFIQARLYDDDYDTWQIMDDLGYYASCNHSYDNLPLKSNGLPFPLEATVIDTSNNPGRWSFKEGYIEFVGSVMWLGDKFWEKTGSSKDKVLACDWLQLEEIGDTIKLRVHDKPFTTADGQEGILQNQLRDLLYS